MRRRSSSIPCLLAALSLVATVGCASSTGPQTSPDPADPNAGGPTAASRGQAALEGALMGAIIGGQMGPIGAAVGAGTMLIYGAITGNVPLQGGGGVSSGPRSEREREAELEAQIEEEVAKQDSLESEIDQELRRQEELLAKIEQNETERLSREQIDVAAQTPAGLDAPDVSDRADPRVAPQAPTERELPEYIFEEERTKVDSRTWSDQKSMAVLKRILDADQDGNPEEIRYFDEKTGEMVRTEHDRDYDGTLDAWSTYRGGQLVSRQLDTNGDREVDVWEDYGGGRMTQREIDRNFDGLRDAFYFYQGDSLLEERHDTNYDTKVDVAIHYSKRRRVRTEEDTDKSGDMDTWTYYRADGKEDVVDRIERDKKGTGEVDTYETYERKNGQTVLAKREEDVNADGIIDVTSVYEDGKLVRREIADPALLPL